MPRSRTLKYEYFRNEQLGHMPAFARLLFAGLWTLADREGRLEDRPEKIRTDLFAYDNELTAETIDHYLDLLDEQHMILRYEVDSVRLIHIVKWTKHQHPHPRETSSTLPEPPANARAIRSSHLGNAKAMSRHAEGEPSPPSTSNTSMPSSTSNTSMPSGLSPHASVVPQSQLPREKKTSRGERLAAGWRLPIEWGEWAMHACSFTREQVNDIAASFADYWHAKAGAGATKLDWQATWRNWCRKARNDGHVRHASNGHHRETLHEARQRTAQAFGVGPAAADDVYNLPPEDCHVIKH